MNYRECIEYIHSIPKFSRCLGNGVLKKLLDALGNPHNGLKFIHVGGTNGKGSVCAMLTAVLKNAGYKTGMFTSPYIERFNERIQINGEEISDYDLAECASEVRNVMEKSGQYVSEFAFVTAAAFLYFKKTNCDFVVLEVGMGGRLDATNVIDKSIVTVITSISLDHTEYLGDTVERIAYEKCGIIKDGGYVVTYPIQNEQALDVIKRTCAEKKADLIIPDMPEKNKDGFLYKGKLFKIALEAVYQPYNAVMAIEAAYALRMFGSKISDEDIFLGIKNAQWPARFERVMNMPPVYIDGAHNINGVQGLCDTLAGISGKIYIVAAMMKDKDIQSCIKQLSVIADRFYATQIDYPRCAAAEDIAKYSECDDTHIYSDCTDAVKNAIRDADDNTVVCICGSLYFAGVARKLIKEINV